MNTLEILNAVLADADRNRKAESARLRASVADLVYAMSEPEAAK